MKNIIKMLLLVIGIHLIAYCQATEGSQMIAALFGGMCIAGYVELNDFWKKAAA